MGWRRCEGRRHAPVVTVQVQTREVGALSVGQEWDADDLRRRIGRLAALPRAHEVFGAIGHHFTLGLRMTRAALSGFEDRNGLLLPDDFASFLTEVGNGGAGPGYGLFPLGMHDGPGDSLQPWDAYLVGRPGRAFPHLQAWNLPAAELQPSVGLTGREEDDWYEQHERVYFATKLIDGAIPLAHMGCAIRVYLVVTGPLAGQVWTDDRASDGGIYPCEPVRFIDWYLAWLADAERILGVVP